MVYGRIEKQVDDATLCSLSEVSRATSSNTLRSLSSFSLEFAEELDRTNSPNWPNSHRYISNDLREALSCDVIAMVADNIVAAQIHRRCH